MKSYRTTWELKNKGSPVLSDGGTESRLIVFTLHSSLGRPQEGGRSLWTQSQAQQWKQALFVVLWNQKVTMERANGDEDGGKGHRATTGVCIDVEHAHAKFFPSHSPVQFSLVTSNSLRSYRLQHTRPPCPSPTLGACSNSCPSSWWCHLNISSSVIPFSSLQSLPASGFSPMSQFFASGGPSIGVSASASVPPMNIQDWFPLGWTGLTSLQSKGLSRVSNTTVQKYQLFSTQLSSQSNSHIHTWPQEKP